MSTTESLEQHKTSCPKCVESAPGLWDLCDDGQELLRQIPTRDWIEEEERQAKRKLASSEARSQAAIGDSLKIAKEGPAFWKDLLTNLKNNTDALPRIKLSGSASLVAAPERGEQTCRVQVINSGVDQTYTDLFYNLGGLEIRCRTLEGKEGHFAFRVLSGGDLAVVQDETEPAMNASYMADFMVKRMAKMVRRG
jgi:hypothetical protein